MQVRNMHTAEDIVQEAFARVWASPKTPKVPSEFKRWLYRSITNLAVDYYRASGRQARQPLVRDESADADDAFDRVLSRSLVMMAMQKLSIRDRQLIYLRYFEDLPAADCARILGLNPVTARVLLTRALSKLKRQVAIAAPREATENA